MLGARYPAAPSPMSVEQSSGHLRPTVLGWLEGRSIKKGVSSVGAVRWLLAEGRGPPAHKPVPEEGSGGGSGPK